MATPADDYHRGEMDIAEQSSTYDAFLKLSKWGSLALAVSLLFVTLLFCTEAGFLGSLGPSVILAVAGFFLLRSKKKAAH